MAIEDLVGAMYGPYPVRVTAEQVGAYVAVTGDDGDRWVKHAPPSFAGALLFSAAPDFLRDPAVVPFTRLLVHADQSFVWHRAVEVDETLTVEGTFERARERSGVIFATFAASIRSGGDDVIESVSTFLMGREAPNKPEEEAEPEVSSRGAYDVAPIAAASEGELPRLARSASRLDLVRYAAASGDFNPVHFDHDTAVEAGFPGIPVHGLLMGAWILQVAASLSSRPDAIAEAKLRFRNPLRPAVTARVSGSITDGGDTGPTVRASARRGDTELVSGRIRLRRP